MKLLDAVKNICDRLKSAILIPSFQSQMWSDIKQKYCSNDNNYTSQVINNYTKELCTYIFNKKNEQKDNTYYLAILGTLAIGGTFANIEGKDDIDYQWDLMTIYKDNMVTHF